MIIQTSSLIQICFFKQVEPRPVIIYLLVKTGLKENTRYYLFLRHFSWMSNGEKLERSHNRPNFFFIFSGGSIKRQGSRYLTPMAIKND